MNLRPTRTIATLAATGVTAALVLTSPMGADAAKMITGKDIKNGSIKSNDIKNGSLQALDFAKGQLPAGPTGPAGPAGKDAAQPVTASFRGDLPASTNGNASSGQSSTAILPAFSQVAGVNITSSVDLAAACGQDGYSLYAVLGSGVQFLPLVAVFKDSSADPVESLGLPQTTGPIAQPLAVIADCGSGNTPATSVTVTYTVAAQNTTASSTSSGTVPVPSSTQALRSGSRVQKMMGR